MQSRREQVLVSLRNAFRRVFGPHITGFFIQMYWKLKAWKYKFVRRPYVPAETSKAKDRRTREGFFDKYIHGRGLDIGWGGDPLTKEFQGWDIENGDAQYLNGIPDQQFDWVYASHTLEHMVDAGTALKNWWRVVKPGGFLIFAVPDRDLYEKKTTLPSRFNPDHKHMFLVDRDEAPDTIGVIPLLGRVLTNYQIEYVRRTDEGYQANTPETHSAGEYAIEAVIRKLS